jgi:predicted nucleotidyltransferase component of viral defense system
MISLAEIKKHYSDVENRLPQMVLKEYIQYKILSIIFSSRYGDDLVFMGGTAIRIVYGGDRFSEDLDLDNHLLSENDFADLTKYIARELERDGLIVEFRNTFKNVYHCYLKFPKILFDNQLSPLADEKIMIRLDSFCTQKIAQPTTHIITKADIFAEVRTYSPEIILAQKIDALFHRKRSKGRDIYDIIYLFSLTEPDYGYLNRVLDITTKEELMRKMRDIFSNKELLALADDVRPFVSNPQKVQQVEKFNAWLESNFM